MVHDHNGDDRVYRDRLIRGAIRIELIRTAEGAIGEAMVPETQHDRLFSVGLGASLVEN